MVSLMIARVLVVLEDEVNDERTCYVSCDTCWAAEVYVLMLRVEM